MKRTLIGAAGPLICGISIAFAAQPGDAMLQHDMHSRQTEVAHRGAAVMPFDLERTTHFFDDTVSGGIETITANAKNDTEQIALIRSHLATEAKRFGRGDFSDPARIHGHDMAGLAELAGAGDKLHVEYRSIPAGASLTFTSTAPAVIAAIHAWFAAQRSDHGAHGHREP
ncbi:aspartate carbamoyltransferase [Cupriavidus pinatubonensis]|uniref:aspartate carbamoyltransferase n=1 Tax=Cupriavidus pinatubonensis TaxID=248026 RepID=UPI001C739CD0|nr:aspartate carbamoyltransferase [Cupriavidus pinatubonensis]QYY28353.1 aspartate carbamoyltransferase [Cupriavidus pinatubonensis]